MAIKKATSPIIFSRLTSLADVWVLDLKYPWRPLKVVRCGIQVKKLGWAIEPNDKRHLLGASAFYTQSSAERAQLGALKKLETKWTYIYRNHAFHHARAALDRLQPNRWRGTIH